MLFWKAFPALLHQGGIIIRNWAELWCRMNMRSATSGPERGCGDQKENRRCIFLVLCGARWNACWCFPLVESWPFVLGRRFQPDFHCGPCAVSYRKRIYVSSSRLDQWGLSNLIQKKKVPEGTNLLRTALRIAGTDETHRKTHGRSHARWGAGSERRKSGCPSYPMIPLTGWEPKPPNSIGVFFFVFSLVSEAVHFQVC